VLPLSSLTVSVTVFGPRWVQLKTLGRTLSWLTIPQLSEPASYTSAVMILALPELFTLTVTSLQVTVGGRLSCTVTVAVQVAVLPLPSLVVSVTVFGPRLVQVKASGETLAGLTVPQLSEPVLNTLLGVIVALPEPSRLTVMF